jgi:hypothetical protein
VHLYEGVTFQEINDTVEKATYAHASIQQKISENLSSDRSVFGNWFARYY